MLTLVSLLFEGRSQFVWTLPSLESEMEEIQRLAEAENLPMAPLVSQFRGGVLTTLRDQAWERLENTDSWSVESLDDARTLAKEYDRDIASILDGFESGGSMPAPIVYKRSDGTITLVAGNTRLMAARALGIRPTVLLMTPGVNYLPVQPAPVSSSL